VKISISSLKNSSKLSVFHGPVLISRKKTDDSVIGYYNFLVPVPAGLPFDFIDFILVSIMSQCKDLFWLFLIHIPGSL
jgi:hypothetical protein